ncbi:MAG TPA: V-type ATP synthase subunit E family protein [Candidatus Thermoplasmatota archaeon]|nr:V-type ATP synthase subunit E family protein [Candidatus Thermoplasmatota archaeon]
MGIDQVLVDVRRDGDERARSILEQARREAEAILAEARRQAAETEKERLAHAQKESAQVTAQAQSRAESEARKAVLITEAELRTQLRAAVLKAFADLPAKGRQAPLKTLLQRAQATIPAGKVWGAEKDAAALKEQRAYTHAGSIPIAGGLVVESEDAKVRLDLSYETLLDEMWRDVLRAEAGLFR